MTVKRGASFLVLTSGLIVLEHGDVTHISEKTKYSVSPLLKTYLQLLFFSHQLPGVSRCHRNNPTCSMLAHCASGGCWLPDDQGEHPLAGFLFVQCLSSTVSQLLGAACLPLGAKSCCCCKYQLLCSLLETRQSGFFDSNQRGSGGGQVSNIHSLWYSLHLQFTSAPQTAFYYLSLRFTTSPLSYPILGAQISSVVSCCNSPMFPVCLLYFHFPFCAPTTQTSISYHRLLRVQWLLCL